MLSKLFEEAYKQMYKQWVLNKIICMPNSISLFYEIPKKNDFRSLNCDEVLSYFSAYFNKYLNDIKLREEFTSYYKKSCLFSFIKYIFDKNHVLSSFKDNSETRALCYINNMLYFLVSEYFISPVDIVKENIIFDNSVSNVELVNRIYNARKYNSCITYNFERGYFGTYVFDIENYIFTDYMWLVQFIKGVGFIEGKKALTNYFKYDSANRESVGIKIKDKNWNIYEIYSLLLDFCEDKYAHDMSVNHGFFDKKFKDLLGLWGPVTYEESFKNFILRTFSVLDGIIVDESMIFDTELGVSPYYDLFKDEIPQDIM